MKTQNPVRAAVVLAPICALAFFAQRGDARTPQGAEERIPAHIAPSFDVKTAREPGTPRPFAAPTASLRPSAVDTPSGAQSREPRAPIARGQRIPHDRMYYDAPGDGSLWARGASYKTSFDARGATYYPWLGPKAPRDVEFTLSPDALKSGDLDVAFDHASSAVRAGDRVEIDRGAFVEAYTLAVQSVEQSFVFAKLPTRGELALHLALPNDLEARASADGIELTSELGRVLYTNAVAIDAKGRRSAVRMELADGGLTLRVDADFVAQAALPLVVDPLVITIPIAVTSSDDYAPDAAYDAANQCWLVVFEETYSSVDRDVFAQLVSSTGAILSGSYVDFTSFAWDHARCANLASAQQFLVVATVPNGANNTINGRTVQAADLSMSAQFGISTGESAVLTNPDVGGDPFGGSPAYYCVAYQRYYSSTDDDVFVRLVNSSGVTVVGPIFLSNSSGTQDDFPSISKSDGTDSWLIAWDRAVNNTSVGIWGGRIRWDGTVLANPFQISALPNTYIPCASSPLIGSQRNVVAFEDAGGPGSSPDPEIWCVFVDGSTPIWDMDLGHSEYPDSSAQAQFEPVVDSDGQHFAVMYTEQVSGNPSDYNVYVTDLGAIDTNLNVTGARTTVASTTNAEHSPRIASAHGSGGPAYRYLATWAEYTSSGTGVDVKGALFDGAEGGRAFGFCFGDGGPFTNPCPCSNYGSSGHGCANSADASGGWLYASGSLSTIHDTTVLNASGLPPTTTALFFQAAAPLATPAVFGDGIRCINGSIVRLGLEVASGGIATYPRPGETPISVRGHVATNGGSWYYQCWYRNSAAFCTSATFNLTSAELIEWAR